MDTIVNGKISNMCGLGFYGDKTKQQSWIDFTDTLTFDSFVGNSLPDRIEMSFTENNIKLALNLEPKSGNIINLCSSQDIDFKNSVNEICSQL